MTQQHGFALSDRQFHQGRCQMHRASVSWACWLGGDSPVASQFARFCEDLSSAASNDRSRAASRFARPKSRRTLARFRASICRSQAVALGCSLTTELAFVTMSFKQRLLDNIRSVELGLIAPVQAQAGQEQ